MKKMNNRGYVLIEIILAFVITFGIIYFMMDMVINIKNKNDDLYVSSIVEVDETIITNKIMNYLIDTDIKNESDAEDFCNNISVDSSINAVKYDDDIVHYVDDVVSVSDVSCNVGSDSIGIKIPLELKQVKKEFDVIINYNYRYNIKNVIDSYWCNNHQDDEEPYSFVYEGDCEVEVDEETLDWKIKFLGIDGYGTYDFTPYFDAEIDAFLVGGGGGGGTGLTEYGSEGHFGDGGGGGGGGYCDTFKTISIVAKTPYIITIGAGGSAKNVGGSTSAFNESISGGKAGGAVSRVSSTNTVGGGGGSGGNAGGTGAHYDNQAANGGSGATACREFGDSIATAYAGGGGGGGGTNWYVAASNPGTGGIGGGGNGGSKVVGKNGTANTGGGGGGGGAPNEKGTASGGSGGSGIVVVRNTRE